ncbi:response regulator transcription factor [Wenyingzhuangia sp. chi5]|uniref:Response regulator transcription factor n=1 Tax=Wenyingzhuangia gilva TaxID=3057677 RepID=A0ABT8VU83_9FLAO|nr:response regulator transcription factor [Wenyingzhuangia sp. chi5]MDO3695534.1 response regulator transcription factor [Wenyingzhuangia sp. chi5]
MNILIIEDDLTLSQNISQALHAETYHTEVVYDGFLAKRLLKKTAFDCIIMDINLPGKNGFELCKYFRQFNTTTPVIMLTAFGELEDKIEGFNCGADDYLTKPFYMRELIIRINALLKRNKTSSNQNNTVLTTEDITLNQSTKKVTRQGTEIVLTPREYQILLKLLENKGEIISKSDLIKEIWGTSFDTNTNTIEVYINFLRNKLDKPFGKKTIKTKVGYGYYLDLE